MYGTTLKIFVARTVRVFLVSLSAFCFLAGLLHVVLGLAVDSKRTLITLGVLMLWAVGLAFTDWAEDVRMKVTWKRNRDG